MLVTNYIKKTLEQPLEKNKKPQVSKGETRGIHSMAFEKHHSSACLAKKEKVGFQPEPAPTKVEKPEQMEGHLPYHLPKRYGTDPQEHQQRKSVSLLTPSIAYRIWTVARIY